MNLTDQITAHASRTARVVNGDIDGQTTYSFDNPETAPANILIVEQDADCADALQILLSDVPGVGTVQTAGTANDALELIATADSAAVVAAAAGDAEVTAFSLLVPAAPVPDVIFIDAQMCEQRDTCLQESLTELRRRLPNAAIVLLCVYPERLRGKLQNLADRCIRKDTSYRELRTLMDDLLGARQSLRPSSGAIA